MNAFFIHQAKSQSAARALPLRHESKSTRAMTSALASAADAAPHPSPMISIAMSSTTLDAIFFATFGVKFLPRVGIKFRPAVEVARRKLRSRGTLPPKIQANDSTYVDRLRG